MSTPNPPKGGNKNKKPADEAKVPDVPSKHFIEEIIEEDNRTGRFQGRVHTRFPPEPNGYLHIGHAKSICLNFGIAHRVRRQVQPALRRHQSRRRRTSSTSIRSRRTSAGSASTGRTGEFYASDYFEQLYEWAEQLIKTGKAYVCDLTAEQMREYRGTLNAARQGEPLSQPLRRGEPRSLPAHEGRRVPRRLAHAARQDRHGVAQHQHARPGDVPHPARRAPSHRRQVVHLPDVRLGPRPVRLDREDHALDLHAGIREPPPALRLVRRGAGHLSPAADRVRPAEPDLHGDEQAQAARAGAGEARQRLGRSAHADDLRASAAAATRRRRSASSASASAWPSSTA